MNPFLRPFGYAGAVRRGGGAWGQARPGRADLGAGALVEELAQLPAAGLPQRRQVDPPGAQVRRHPGAAEGKSRDASGRAGPGRKEEEGREAAPGRPRF